MWSNLNSHPRSYSTALTCSVMAARCFWDLGSFRTVATLDCEEQAIMNLFWNMKFLLNGIEYAALSFTEFICIHWLTNSILWDWWCKLRKCNMHWPKWSCLTASSQIRISLGLRSWWHAQPSQHGSTKQQAQSNLPKFKGMLAYLTLVGFFWWKDGTLHDVHPVLVFRRAGDLEGPTSALFALCVI